MKKYKIFNQSLDDPQNLSETDPRDKDKIFFTVSGHQDMEMFCMLTSVDNIYNGLILTGQDPFIQPLVPDADLLENLTSENHAYTSHNLKIFENQVGTKTIYPGVNINAKVFITSTATPARTNIINGCYLKIYSNTDFDPDDEGIDDPIKMDINFL